MSTFEGFVFTLEFDGIFTSFPEGLHVSSKSKLFRLSFEYLE